MLTVESRGVTSAKVRFEIIGILDSSAVLGHGAVLKCTEVAPTREPVGNFGHGNTKTDTARNNEWMGHLWHVFRLRNAS